MIEKDDLFSREECIEFINWIENSTKFNFTPSGITSYHYCKLDNTFPGYYKIRDWCNQKLRFQSNGWIICLKYFDGNYFQLHIDRLPEYEFSKESLINVNVVLNDNYDGGLFYTKDEYYENEPGKIYWYPSNQPHGVTEVKNGIRYVLLYTISEFSIDTNSKSAI